MEDFSVLVRRRVWVGYHGVFLLIFIICIVHGVFRFLFICFICNFLIHVSVFLGRLRTQETSGWMLISISEQSNKDSTQIETMLFEIYQKEKRSCTA